MVYCDGTYLVSDTSAEELHQLCFRLGIPRDQFSETVYPIYEVSKEQGRRCWIMGARYCRTQDLIKVFNSDRRDVG